MPTVSFTISSSDLTRMVTALSIRYGYQSKLSDGNDNPQSANEFVRLRIAKWVKDETKAHELNTARAAVTVTEVDIT